MRLGSNASLAAIREGSRGGGIGGGRHRLRRALVVVQVALALVLMVGSGLMVRTFQRLRSVDPGFDTSGVLTFDVRPIPIRYGAVQDASPEQIAQVYDNVARLFERLRERIEALPGVTAAGGINTLPLAGTGAFLTATIEEFPPTEDEMAPAFYTRRATPGYFEAMRIPLVEGRTFTDDDHRLHLASVIISESVKRKYWPETSALGKRIRVGGSSQASVVGVVGDVSQMSLEAGSGEFLYVPVVDSIGRGTSVLTMAVRTRGNPLSIVRAMREIAIELDPDMPLDNMRTMQMVVGESISRTTFTMALLMIGAFIALFLGGVGIYGVISYIMVQRTSEIGVRMALGADPREVRRLVLQQGLVLTTIGLALGLLATVALGTVMSTLLYGVSRFDLVTLSTGLGGFLAIATLATAIPAIRASRIPPSEALRPR